jgi:hypothetical protein
MNRKRLMQWMSVGMLFILAACQAAGMSHSATVVEPKGALEGLNLATGAADAAPLWAFCSASQENTHIRTFDCRAPVWQTLAVGHLFLLADTALSNGHGSDLAWQLAIDDYIVDLESFGTFDYVMPAMPESPSPIREVFSKVTGWNLVMTNLNPGDHTLSFRAQNETNTYLWLVNLVIEGDNSTDISAAPFPLHS